MLLKLIEKWSLKNNKYNSSQSYKIMMKIFKINVSDSPFTIQRGLITKNRYGINDVMLTKMLENMK